MNLHNHLFVAGGLAVVLAACSAATPDPTSVPVATEVEAMEEIVPSVTVADQDASGGTVTIEKVVSAQPGWLVIHITEDGAPGPVIGVSPVSEGSNSDVQVAIDLDQATEQLFAMLHLDAGTEGEYEFPGDDVPVFVDDVIVNVPFQAEFSIEDKVTADDQASGGDETVLVIDSSYRLQVLEVSVGTTVTWVYSGGLPHTVSSDTNLFDSGTMGEGDRFSYTFEESGTFPYYCMFHGSPGGGGMSGVVNVKQG